MLIDEATAFPPSVIIRTLGARFKDMRIRMNLTQKEIAFRSGLSLPTIYKFENGRLHDLSMASFLKLLRSIDMLGNWEKLIPEYPVSPYMFRGEKKKQRIRHPKTKCQ